VADKFIRDRRRVRDLSSIIQWRCGQALPDDDAGRDYLKLMLDHYAHFPDGRTKSVHFAELWAPWLPERERDELIDLSQRMPRRWSAIDLGRELNLTREERQERAVTTIRAVDQSDDELREQRNAKKRERQAEKRRLAALERKAAAAAPQPARRRTEREISLIAAVGDGPGWMGMDDLIGAICNEKCWCRRNGRPFDRETMRRLINRLLGPLVDDGTFEGCTTGTKWGQTARKVRLQSADASAVTRRSVPASGAGTPGQMFHEN
jgi:hypothetical protein